MTNDETNPHAANPQEMVREEMNREEMNREEMNREEMNREEMNREQRRLLEQRLRENRSFVIRQARMSPHQREAYERLAPRYVVPDGEGLLDWDAVFPHRTDAGGGDRAIVVDIGFGMGQELAEIAENDPETDFLGIEVHKPGIGRLLGQLEKRGIENVRVMRADAVTVCAGRIPAGSLTGVHLFFPDPWPKKRHHKRRLVRPGFPELVTPLLAPGGYLYAVTDWEDYAHQMLDVLNAAEGLVNDDPGGRFAAPQPWRPETAFERKGLAKGHRIQELLFRRKAEQG